MQKDMALPKMENVNFLPFFVLNEKFKGNNFV